jgi:hypothetical protein
LDIVNARHAGSRITPFYLVKRCVLPLSGCRFVLFDLVLDSVFAFVRPSFLSFDLFVCLRQAVVLSRCFSVSLFGFSICHTCVLFYLIVCLGRAVVLFCLVVWIQYLPLSGRHFKVSFGLENSWRLVGELPFGEMLVGALWTFVRVSQLGNAQTPAPRRGQ